jgi:hypothetical protein
LGAGRDLPADNAEQVSIGPQTSIGITVRPPVSAESSADGKDGSVEL